jgi:hypothetical protein
MLICCRPCELEALLHEQCQAKRLKPSSGTVPSQPDGCSAPPLS